MGEKQSTKTYEPEGLEVIVVDDVSKHFRLNKDRSLKNRLLHPRRAREGVMDFWALRDVNLVVDAGTTVGLIGPNGSGKSTLLKIIGNIIEPSSGFVATRGRVAALLELGTGFHPDLTGRQNIYLNAAILGLSKEETDERFDDIVEFSEMERFIDTQVKYYSSGMYVRLAFSVAIHVDPDILLVDEVLAVGDESFQQKCLDKIREFQRNGCTILFVSHAMDQITSLCTRAVVLDHGKVAFDGSPTDAVEKLRQGFQSSERHQLPTHSGPDEYRIESVVVTPEDGERVEPGQTLDIDVELSSPAPLQDWSLELAIVNTMGTVILSTSTKQLGLAGKELPEHAVVRFKLPNLSLGGGGYTVTASLFDGQRNNVAHWDAAAYFVVETDRRATGLVYSPATAVVNSAQDQSE